METRNKNTLLNNERLVVTTITKLLICKDVNYTSLHISDLNNSLIIHTDTARNINIPVYFN